MRIHGKKISWYLRLEKQGVKVKALSRMPELSKIDSFYLDLFNYSEGRVPDLLRLNDVYQMDNDELFFAIQVISMITAGLQNADSSSQPGQQRGSKRPSGIQQRGKKG